MGALTLQNGQILLCKDYFDVDHALCLTSSTQLAISVLLCRLEVIFKHSRFVGVHYLEFGGYHDDLTSSTGVIFS